MKQFLTSVAMGKQRTNPRRQLMKVSEDSNCMKWSGRTAISPLATVWNKAICWARPITIIVR